MDESASETTSRHTKAHILTKSFHKSDREPIGTLEQNMQGPSKTNTRTRNLDVFMREGLNL